MRVSTFVTSTCLMLLLIANGANAQFWRTSTTDYLVRFQALRYLEEQSELKVKLENKLKEVKANATAVIEEEKQLWESQIEAAKVSLAQVTQDKMRVLEAMKKEYQGKVKGIDTAIEAKHKEIENLNKPKSFFSSLFSADTTADDLNSHYTEISHLQDDLNRLQKDPPEFAHVVPTEEMKLKIQEANDAIAVAITNIKNLGGQTKIRRLKSTAARLKANIESLNKPVQCMITLAKCKAVTNWDSIPAGKLCTADNLKNGKIKAINAKCAALTIDSKWSDVDGCIAEYRTDILKKSGTEGLSAEFRKCRSL